MCFDDDEHPLDITNEDIEDDRDIEDSDCWDDDDSEADRYAAYREDHEYEDDYLIDGVGFADPGGRSALRAETRDNPRNLPCPTCGRPNMLTPLDKRAGYQCDICADQAERGGY